MFCQPCTQALVVGAVTRTSSASKDAPTLPTPTEPLVQELSVWVSNCVPFT